MKFNVITLFPQLIETYTQASIIGRATESGQITVNTINPRDFTVDPHRKVDDTPYGGGSGMVLMCQPVHDAFKTLEPLAENTRILMTTPAGRQFDHSYAKELSQSKELVILCGHYEGFDHRIYDLIPNIEEVSIGDYVLTGGELPALTIIDAVSRLIPGVVQKFDSVEADSFYNGLLDHPHYTRPGNYQGLEVPEVLMSGHHGKIEKWRRKKALEETARKRPDLVEKAKLTKEETLYLKEFY